MPAKPAKSAAKKAPTKKQPAKKSSLKKIAKKSAPKPLPANREPAAKRAVEAPSGHGVAKLEIKPERIAEILKILYTTYPDVECALVHTSPWQLLVATILSAQCTDVRVNMVTPKLFATYPTPEAMANAPIEAIEKLIRTTGFYHNKTKSIQGAGRVISEQFHNKVPQTMANC